MHEAMEAQRRVVSAPPLRAPCRISLPVSLSDHGALQAAYVRVHSTKFVVRPKMSSLLRFSSEFWSGVQPSNGKSVLLTSEYCRCEILNSIGYGLRLLRINFKGSCQPTRKINAEGNDGNQAER